jgi:hypothetical protein
MRTTRKNPEPHHLGNKNKDRSFHQKSRKWVPSNNITRWFTANMPPSDEEEIDNLFGEEDANEQPQSNVASDVNDEEEDIFGDDDDREDETERVE